MESMCLNKIEKKKEIEFTLCTYEQFMIAVL